MFNFHYKNNNSFFKNKIFLFTKLSIFIVEKIYF
jgi:hypothetical protein